MRDKTSTTVRYVRDTKADHPYQNDRETMCDCLGGVGALTESPLECVTVNCTYGMLYEPVGVSLAGSSLYDVGGTT